MRPLDLAQSPHAAPHSTTPKTLHLTNSWHAASGGIATFYRALMEEAARRCHLMRLVVPGECDRVEDLSKWAKIYYVKSSPAPFNSQYHMIRPTQFLFPGSIVQNILIEERPDIVEICDKYTLNYLGPLLRRGLLRSLDFRPLVLGLSCERMDDSFRAYIGNLPFSRSFCAAYVKWLYFPFFDHHIANSDYTAEELRSASRGQMVLRNTWIRPMGVDLRRFSPARRTLEARQLLRRSLGANDASVLLLYAGRLVPEKNLALLFDALVCLAKTSRRDYRLVVAGEGIERSRWEASCTSLVPGRVSFLGHVGDADQLADLIANVDAFVHPNHREPFGIAPLEAMASGLPVVVPDCGGVGSYANSENAWIARPNAQSFASAIEALVADAAETTRRSQNALLTAAEFSWRKVAASFLNLYAQLHHMERSCGASMPAPGFSSTPAKGLELAVSRGVSRSAEKIFRLLLNPRT
jgi:alpha-1,6-mannosyltransferase